MPSYPHWLRVEDRTQRGAGTQDLATGIVTRSGADLASVLYDDACDAQSSEKVIERDANGVPTVVATAKVFLADESRIGEIKEGMVAVVTFQDGSKEDGQVARVNRMDGTLLLTRL